MDEFQSLQTADVQEKILLLINNIMASFSAASALAVLFILGSISLYDYKLVNRVSLKLCSAIAVVDIFRSISYTFYLYIKEEGPLCHFNAMFINFIILCHMLLSVGIALNLQLLFLNRAIYRGWWQWVYWFLGLGLPFIATLIVALFGAFGYDPISGVCFYKNVYTNEAVPHVLLWTGFLVLNILGSIYCLLIAIFTITSLKDGSGVLFKLKMKSNSSSSEDGCNNKPRLTVSEETIQLLVRRITIYCLIPTLTQSGCVLAVVYEEIHGEIPYWMFVFDIIATHLSGILSLIGFLYDPALKNSLTYIRMDLKNYQSKDGSRINYSAHPRPFICRVFSWILYGKGGVEQQSEKGISSKNAPIQNILIQLNDMKDANENQSRAEDVSLTNSNYSYKPESSMAMLNSIPSQVEDSSYQIRNPNKKHRSYFKAVSGL